MSVSPPRRLLAGGPGARAEAEIEERRSRFLCTLVRVETEDQARSAIDEARRVHHAARHHCSAFVLDLSDGRRIERSNDDGEPSGTAGPPMLETLRGGGLVDTVAIVTRWFGGVLLGTGGLVRAYTDAVGAGIAAASLVGREERLLCDLSLPVAEAGRVEAELRARGVDVLGTDWGARAVMHLAAPEADLTDLDALVAAVTQGRGTLERGETVRRDVPLA
jgi:uncharacterized YigZ family protein